VNYDEEADKIMGVLKNIAIVRERTVVFL